MKLEPHLDPVQQEALARRYGPESVIVVRLRKAEAFAVFTNRRQLQEIVDAAELATAIERAALVGRREDDQRLADEARGHDLELDALDLAGAIAELELS